MVMQIRLSPAAQRFIDEKVRAGQYPDADAVVSDAIEMLMETDEISPQHKEYLRQEVRKGLDQANRGDYAEFTAEQIIAEKRAQRRGTA